MFLKRLSLIAGFCVLFTGCSVFSGGQDVDKGVSAYETDSTARMGVRYLFGRGVPQNDAKAFENFHKAAQKGNAFAQNEVAYLYAAGKGTRRNYPEALYWYQKAAKQNVASAQYNLGLMYIHGLGTRTNKSLGLRWVHRAAQQGFEPAKSMLATT